MMTPNRFNQMASLIAWLCLFVIIAGGLAWFAGMWM